MSTNPKKPPGMELALNELAALRQMARGAVSVNADFHTRLVTNLFNFDRRFAAVGAPIDKPGRDIDLECGYPTREWDTHQYKRMFDYVGLANRAVKVFPVECWSVYPELYETDDPRVTKFERRWKDVETRLAPWTALQDLDVKAGVNQFGILVIGFPGDAATPVAGMDPRTGERLPAFKDAEPWQDVGFLRAYSQVNVVVKTSETDFSSPRYGMPTAYTVKVTDPRLQNPTAGAFNDVEVHWTRVIHFADNTDDDNPAYGVSRIRPVRNPILDCRKILGADAEGFWQTGFPGYAVETLPQLVEDGELDLASAEEQWRRFRDELRRVMFLHGTTIKSLNPSVEDPTAHMLQPLQIICATLEVPLPIFLGQIEGHLAGTNNLTLWNRRLANRQRNKIDPKLIKPFVDRLIAGGVLPAPKRGYVVDWRDLNAVSDEVRADIALKRSQAMMQYVTGKCYELMRPLHYMTLVMGYALREATAIIKAAGGEDALIEKLKAAVAAAAKPQGGGRVGNAPAATPGRPANATGTT